MTNAPRVFRTIALSTVIGLTLSACQQEGLDLGIAATPRTAPGIPVAFESLDGGTDQTRTRMWTALASEAAVRRIELVAADKKPRYRIRGYLDAYATADGKAAVSYVWDVYDTTKKRAQRIQGAAPVRAGASDIWTSVDDAALTRTAAQSLDEIAGFLTAQTMAGPGEAARIAGSSSRPSTGIHATENTAKGLTSFAPVD